MIAGLFNAFNLSLMFSFARLWPQIQNYYPYASPKVRATTTPQTRIQATKPSQIFRPEHLPHSGDLASFSFLRVNQLKRYQLS